jgi:hypothetical protein
VGGGGQGVVVSSVNGMDDMLWIVGVAALVVFMIVRRMMGEPLRAKRLLVLPLVVAVIGAGQVGHVAHVRAVDVAVLAFEAVFAVAVGVARGASVHIYVRDGHVWFRYRWITLALWLVSAALRLGLREAGALAGADHALLMNTLLFMVALTLAGEACVVGLRALRTGAPFAPSGQRRTRLSV